MAEDETVQFLSWDNEVSSFILGSRDDEISVRPDGGDKPVPRGCTWTSTGVVVITKPRESRSKSRSGTCSSHTHRRSATTNNVSRAARWAPPKQTPAKANSSKL